MKLFKSNEPNTFHYVTLVTFNRVQVFRSDQACEIFVGVLKEVREKYPYKLIGYVFMPDHVHAIVNNSCKGGVVRTSSRLEVVELSIIFAT